MGVTGENVLFAVGGVALGVAGTLTVQWARGKKDQREGTKSVKDQTQNVADEVGKAMDEITRMIKEFKSLLDEALKVKDALEAVLKDKKFDSMAGLQGEIHKLNEEFKKFSRTESNATAKEIKELKETLEGIMKHVDELFNAAKEQAAAGGGTETETENQEDQTGNPGGEENQDPQGDQQ